MLLESWAGWPAVWSLWPCVRPTGRFLCVLPPAHTHFFPLLHPQIKPGVQEPSLSGRHVAMVASCLNGPLMNLLSKVLDALIFTSHETHRNNYGLNGVPPKCVEILTPGTYGCDLIWKWGLCRGNLAKTRLYWIRRALIQ